MLKDRLRQEQRIQEQLRERMQALAQDSLSEIPRRERVCTNEASTSGSVDTAVEMGRTEPGTEAGTSRVSGDASEDVSINIQGPMSPAEEYVVCDPNLVFFV